MQFVVLQAASLIIALKHDESWDVNYHFMSRFSLYCTAFATL